MIDSTSQCLSGGWARTVPCHSRLCQGSLRHRIPAQGKNTVDGGGCVAEEACTIGEEHNGLAIGNWALASGERRSVIGVGAKLSTLENFQKMNREILGSGEFGWGKCRESHLRDHRSEWRVRRWICSSPSS